MRCSRSWAIGIRAPRARGIHSRQRLIARCCRCLVGIRHRPIRGQHRTLSQKLLGHDGYYGLTGNFALLAQVKLIAVRAWQKWLSRRSWEGRSRWGDMVALLGRLPLPAPRVVHPVYRSG